ncbi:MAG TPA: ferritin family protein [Candidatus Hydrogenedentes bacterium]|nr:ferritin family protein [Candidatus Hydrogenedentota bacterium]
MPPVFTAEKVFNTAIKIERNGAAFYAAAAKQTSNEAMKKLFLQLSAAERTHAQVYVRLKGMILESQKAGKGLETEGILQQYLHAFAKGGIFNLTMDTVKALAEMRSFQEILEFAIERERDSILFYTAVKELVPKKLGRSKVDAIIYEEMAHLATLNQELARHK